MFLSKKENENGIADKIVSCLNMPYTEWKSFRMSQGFTSIKDESDRFTYKIVSTIGTWSKNDISITDLYEKIDNRPLYSEIFIYQEKQSFYAILDKRFNRLPPLSRDMPDYKAAWTLDNGDILESQSLSCGSKHCAFKIILKDRYSRSL